MVAIPTSFRFLFPEKALLALGAIYPIHYSVFGTEAADRFSWPYSYQSTQSITASGFSVVGTAFRLAEETDLMVTDTSLIGAQCPHVIRNVARLNIIHLVLGAAFQIARIVDVKINIGRYA